jgi:hypothetical protein
MVVLTAEQFYLRPQYSDFLAQASAEPCTPDCVNFDAFAFALTVPWWDRRVTLGAASAISQ